MDRIKNHKRSETRKLDHLAGCLAIIVTTCMFVSWFICTKCPCDKTAAAVACYDSNNLRIHFQFFSGLGFLHSRNEETKAGAMTVSFSLDGQISKRTIIHFLMRRSKNSIFFAPFKRIRFTWFLPVRFPCYVIFWTIPIYRPSLELARAIKIQFVPIIIADCWPFWSTRLFSVSFIR